uniref:DNA-directed RNA polymerase III subunit RPC3 n=1 Tax=Coccolithus braarudii TaxID=221442 RepID=A0A7S0L894_9EUKA
MAVLPENATRPLLMRMLQAEYVMLAEVSRTNDHNPRSTTYLWYVDLPKAYRTVERELLKTLYNLQCRLQAERKKEPLALADESAEEAASLAQRRVDYLTHMMLKVHETLMLMRCF